jgi:hypothetical protein
MYEEIREKHDALECEVLDILIDAINKSTTKSKHMDCNAIQITNLSNYTELVIVHNQLTFLNEDGNHYCIYAETSLDELIDIIQKL